MLSLADTLLDLALWTATKTLGATVEVIDVDAMTASLLHVPPGGLVTAAVEVEE